MTWHVMNCEGVNGMTHIIDRDCIENGYDQRDGIVNDMLFCFVCDQSKMDAPIAPHYERTQNPNYLPLTL